MQTPEYLKQKAKDIRRLMLRMANAGKAEGAHIGPALSLADIVAVLFFSIMEFRPKEPKWPDRDRFLLSKGHGVLALYAPLALCGFFPMEEADTFVQSGTRLAGHPSALGLGGLEHPAGSLGHGLSVGCGMALAAKMEGRDYKTYVALGDGECGEGSIWEAAMFAKQHALGNLVAVVDENGFQYGGRTSDIMDLSPLHEKWRAFGWNVTIVDGHDVVRLQAALSKARLIKDVPSCVICKTIKGKGVSFFENDNNWHHASLDDAMLEKALAELQ